MKIFEIEFFNPFQAKVIVFAESAEKAYNRFPGNVYRVLEIVIV